LRQATYLRQIEEEAALFALEALPPEEAGRFRQRLDTGCSLCRGLLDECRNTVAILPLAAPDAEPSPDLRKRLMDRVAAGEKGRRTMVGSLVRADDTPWEPSSMPGIETRRLFGEKTLLVRMAPGTVFPEHQHSAAEQCLILEGSIRAGPITAYAGDYTYMPKGSSHPPLISETGCTLLIAYT